MEENRSAHVQPWKISVLLLLLAAFTSVKGDGVLYPYGPEAGDNDVGDIGNQPTTVQLPIPMKYYGDTFNTAYILKDGMVALEPGLQYVDLEWREGTSNLAIDRPFIAPFHYNGFIALSNPQAYPGKIYYKLMSKAGQHITLTEEDRELMNHLDDYLNNASVVLKMGFKSKFVLKVTWENVSSDGACDENQLTSSGCLSNTFQVLIAANEEHTFAIFNYYKMEIPFTVHQLAGLNGGHGRGWTDVIPCIGQCAKRSKGDKNRISSLVERIGSDVAGRFILVIGNDTIVRGGCLAEGLKYPEMEVYPHQAGMFGGEMLSVSGICNPPDTKIYCRFGGNREAISEGVMETRMRGRCPVPILTTRGEVLLEMSTDKMSWKTKTYITIIHPSRMPLPIDLSGIRDAWYELHPKELKLRWKYELFSHHQASTLDVNLIGYREDKNAEPQLIMKNLIQLASNVLNRDEAYSVDPSLFTCTGSDCLDFEIALVQLRLKDQYVDKGTKYQAINVGPVPIGWYVKEAMRQKHGTNWSSAKCLGWNERDRRSSAWLDHLLPCPCTLTQALADWGRWQPGMGCSMFAGSVCTYHTGAIHCVRSVHPSPDASGNQCCYGKDGHLRYAADTYQGSTPDRSHDWGAAPFASPDHVPSLSHWLHDVVTFYYCCLWVEYQECNYYMKRRATRDCKAYQPPDSATVYGDPHVSTFDGTNYHFGGSGDFWLIKSAQLNVQGRFEQRENEVLQITQMQLAPTNLTSVVMWIPTSDVITIKLAPPGGPTNRKLDVLVGTQRRFFEDSRQLWQDFNNVSIVNNVGTAQDEKDKQHSNFTVLFMGGAAVQVAERQGLLHVIVSLPPNSGLTEGLLGTRDGDSSNDFKDPQGNVVPAESQPDVVYLYFAKSWGVSSNESKFHWPKKVDEKKTPLFGDAKMFAYKQGVVKPADKQVDQVCGNSLVCRRDYYVTNDVSVARDSKKTQETFEALQVSQSRVRTCGHLNIPMSEKSPMVHTEGTVVRVTGCRTEGEPQGGPLVYTCNSTAVSADPVWMPKPNNYLCLDEQTAEKASDVGMIVGIVVGAVAVIVITVVVIIILMHGRRKREETLGERADRPVPTKRTNVAADVAIDPGTDESLLKRGGRDAVKMSEVITEMKDRKKSEEV